MQDAAQAAVDLNLSGLAKDRNVHNASVIVINPHTGAILVMIGSRDFNDEYRWAGQCGAHATAAWSSIKPFTYMAAFRKRLDPATVLWDVPISYQIPGFGEYRP